MRGMNDRLWIYFGNRVVENVSVDLVVAVYTVFTFTSLGKHINISINKLTIVFFS